MTALGAALPTPVVAQDPLEVGAEAPDFTLPGATRYGVLADSIRLSDYEGETLRVDVRVEGSRLPRPVEYRLIYRRR